MAQGQRFGWGMAASVLAVMVLVITYAPQLMLVDVGGP